MDNILDTENTEEYFLPDDLFTATQNSFISYQTAMSLQQAREKVSSITSDEFLLEAYNSATYLRNSLGDADGMVADMAETIRMNILVIAATARKDPSSLILSAARSIHNSIEQLDFINTAIETLETYRDSIGECNEY
jgi:hypothetical protein